MGKRSVGMFNPDDWVAQGQRLLYAARYQRTALTAARTDLRRRQITESTWTKMHSGAQTSHLLLGYAAESFLKSGIARLYAGSSETAFRQDVQGLYGHKLARMADALGLSVPTKETDLLHRLETYLKDLGRYPIEVSDRNDYVKATNANYKEIYSRAKYLRSLRLVRNIAQQARTWDQTSKNPRVWGSYNVEGGGFLSYRIGGDLPTRVTLGAAARQDKEQLSRSLVFDMLNQLRGKAIAVGLIFKHRESVDVFWDPMRHKKGLVPL